MFAVVATDAIFAAFKKVLGDDPYDTVTGLTSYKKYVKGQDALKSVGLLNLSSIGVHNFFFKVNLRRKSNFVNAKSDNAHIFCKLSNADI